MRLRRKAFFSSSGFSVLVAVTGTEYNIDARARAVAAGWNQIDPLVLTVAVSPTGLIGSASTTMAALRFVGAYPSGSFLNLVVQAGGRVLGAGGVGGRGRGVLQVYGQWGASGNAVGGNAIQTVTRLYIENYGLIAGGGGGGGGGGCGSLSGGSVDNISGSGAGGGAGAVVGEFGKGAYTFNPTTGVVVPGNNGGAASLTTGGAGGAAYYHASGAISFSGGKGGDLGQPGAAGGAEVAGAVNGSAIGGPAGAYIDGASLTTWVNTGTRLGRAIN